VATAESNVQVVERDDKLKGRPSLMAEYEEAKETRTGALASSNPRMDRLVDPR
jgi:hypothetical protein